MSRIDYITGFVIKDDDELDISKKSVVRALTACFDQAIIIKRVNTMYFGSWVEVALLDLSDLTIEEGMDIISRDQEIGMPVDLVAAALVDVECLKPFPIRGIMYPAMHIDIPALSPTQ